jgi:hypothetical protein
MDEFFKHLFENDNYEDDDADTQKERIEEFKSSYQKCTQLSSKYDISELQFLSFTTCDETALFTIPNTDIVARYYVDSDDTWLYGTQWNIPERHELTVGVPSTLDGVELLPNSSSKIEYVLYPYEQGCDLPMSYLIPTIGSFLDETSLKNVYESDSKLHHVIKWTDELTLILDFDKPYKVVLNGEFLSGFVDEETHFQLGDGGTLAYIDKDKNLIVCQCGDVSSVVIIKYF